MNNARVQILDMARAASEREAPVRRERDVLHAAIATAVGLLTDARGDARRRAELTVRAADVLVQAHVLCAADERTGRASSLAAAHSSIEGD